MFEAWFYMIFELIFSILFTASLTFFIWATCNAA